MSRRYRVVQMGTGLTGQETLAGILDDPDLDLVGVHVSSPDKVGADAGTLCGAPITGVQATGRIDTVIALAPDCLCYCATAVRREREAVEDIARFLRAGINIVTIATIPMVHPPAAPAEWRSELEAAAREAQSTFTPLVQNQGLSA
jgi:hypothetical protein